MTHMHSKNDAYGSILVSNQERRVSIPKGEVEQVNKISSQEFCSDTSDIVKSETVKRILKVVGNIINRGKMGEEHEDIEKIASLYDKVFKEGYPISKKERKTLLDFFSFFRKDVLMTGNTILSKISILQSDDNKAFIRRFLEDEKSGNYNSWGFINHIGGTVFNYPFVVDIDIFGGENIEYVDSIEGTGKLYFYKDSAGSYRIFLIKEDNKIIYLKEKFEQVPKILDNGPVFGVRVRGADNENRSDMPDIMDEFEDIQRSFHSQIGTLYKFDSKTDALEEIYKKGGLVSIEELDHEYGFFQTTSESEKKGVIKIVETDTGEWKVSEILQELYDKIYMGPDGFIVTEREISELQEDSQEKKEMIIGIHTEAWDDRAYPENKLTGKTLLGEQGVLWDMPWSQISNYSGFNRVNFIDSTNICSVLTIGGNNCYVLNKEQQTVTPIDGLQGVYTTINNDFFSGIPTLVKENGKSFVKVFDTDTNTVKNLIEIHTEKKHTIHVSGESPVIELYFFGKNQLVETEEYFYFHEGKLYDLKKGFDLEDGNIYEKRFLRTSKDLGISFHEDFGKIGDYLEEIQTPITVYA
ncbi:TPA: hypothetical protein DCZ36_00730 [Candidatus Gracilibacteria bacterium]|nr:hypothetical protein [Candidatus Gracilibacteria bacterium]